MALGKVTNEWSEEALQNSELIFRQSVQDLVKDATRPKDKGGRIPVDLGNLRNDTSTRVNDALLAMSTETSLLSISGLELGDTVRFEFRAVYAAYQEYTMANFFMRGAVEQWEDFVETNAESL